MMDYNTTPVTWHTIENVIRSSKVSGSAINQHAPSQPFFSPTGSSGINTDWLMVTPKSGQSLQFVESHQNQLEMKLEIIKSVFGMTETQIAKRVGVSRKTLFNWKQKESAPTKLKAQNIFDLYMLAKNWKDAGFTTNSVELDTPVIDGMSIKDLLTESNLDSEKILFAGNRLSHRNLNETELF